MNICYSDFNSICRLCLTKNNVSNSVLQNSVLKLLISLGVNQIEVNESDDLPRKICNKCEESIEHIFKFISKCKESNDILKSILLHEKGFKNKSETHGDLCNYSKDYKQDNKFINSIKKVEQDTITNENLPDKNFKKKLRSKTLRYSTKKLESRNTNITCKKCNLVVNRFCLGTHYKKNVECRPSNFKLYHCEFCSKEFISLRGKTEHVNVHTGDTPYKCPYCIQEFQFKSKWHEHIYRHKVKLGLVEKTGAYTEKRVRLKLKCDKCEKVFASRSGFQQHKLKHEGKALPKKHEGKLDTNVKPFLCNYCAMSFNTKAHLNAHLRVHTGERPYKCSLCDQQFKQKGTLDRHTLSHLDVRPRPFVCDVCQKSYTTKAHMEIHKRLHTGEKPYKCNFCQKSFNYRTHWKVHLRMHTGESPFVCHICKSSYHDKGSFRKHQKKKNHMPKKDLEDIHENSEKPNNES